MKPHPRVGTLRRLVLTGLSLGLLWFAPGPAPQARASKAAVPLALVNAASYSETVAPGSIAALFSSNLTNQAPQVAGTLPLPSTLAGLSAKIGGIAAPLFFASASQINLQVPSGVALGTATVEVFFGGSATPVAAGSVTVADSSPGVFTVDTSGKNQASVLNSDYSTNADFDRFPGSRPEASGNFVVIYATGIGRTNPLVGDGQPSPGNPFATSDGPTTVTIGGVSAQVLFSGLAPGFVGLWQINAVLAGSLPTNLATDLAITLKGKGSQPTTLAVANKAELGSVSGAVVSALNGAAVGGAGVTLQKVSGGAPRQAITTAQGEYRFYVIGTGNYTLAATAAGFIPATQPANIAGGADSTLPPIALTVALAAEQYRVVVAWKSGVDFDAHLTGPSAGGSRFHVWWNGETDLRTPATAQFDRDDQTGAGPETLTFTALASGVYRFSVQDYSHRDFNGSMGFATAQVTVRIYAGNQQVAVLTPPTGGGTLWKVFELTNGQLNLINQLGDEPDPSNIRILF